MHPHRIPPTFADTGHRAQSRRGFALLITITLVAFLVLILVTLASLTRVETTVAANSQQMSMARQNALAALNIALGELQKYAGPDQRATATADIEVAAPAAGAAKWTGVWGNANNPQSDAAADMASAPVRLQWLVSGNEQTDFNPVTHLSTAAASFGQITTAPSAWDYTPGSGTNNVTTTATIHTDITVGTDDAVLLVGPATAGTDTGAENNYVVAPLVDIKVAPSNIPGAGTTGGDVLVGKYAWWVGDEGVKARINLVDPYVTPAPAMTAGADPASPFRLMAPQRLGVEHVPGFESFPVNNEVARKILSVEQSGLTHASITPTVRQSRFHDLTTSSSGVLADQRRGGLKRDLTFAFAQSLPNYRAALDLSSPTVNPLIPTTIMPANEHGPTWEQLHSFANLDGSAPIAPQPQTASQHGIYPILVQARIAFGGMTEDSVTPEHQNFVNRFFPSFVLANPYTVAIAPAKYRVRLDFQTPSTSYALFEGNQTEAFWRMTLQALFEGQIFELNCDEPLLPGEARVFTLASSPNDEQWAPVKVYPMTNDWDAGAAAIAQNTGVDLPNSVFSPSGPRGPGVHPVFAASASGAPTWNPHPLISTPSTTGGTLAWTLTNENDEVYQRIDNIGHSGYAVSQYGFRGAVPLPPTIGLSLLLFRMADSGNLGLSGNFAQISYYPYFSHGNPRAPFVSRTAWYQSSSGKPALDSPVLYSHDFRKSPNAANPSFAHWLRLDPGQSGYTHVEWQGVAQTPGALSLPQARVKWASFDVPRDSVGLVSLGQFQHFNTGGHNAGMTQPSNIAPLNPRPASNRPWRPRYLSYRNPIGNSRANPHIQRDRIENELNTEPYYDQSYLLNRQLFDGYFFSTYPQSQPSVDLASERLANTRLTPFRSDVDLDDPVNFRGGGSFTPEQARLAARNLMLTGAFNINTTSIEAWRAMLSAFSNTEFNDEQALEGPFIRSVHQSAGSSNADNGTHDDAWNGFRNLTELQIEALATEIVAQIKMRGVSLSLSDFVNRKLLADSHANGAHGLSGPLQSALDATNINAEFFTPNPSQTLKNSSGNDISPTTLTQHGTFNYPDHLPKHALEGIAGWLTQADVIQALAPAITARSDTFKIRTYGETRNPATGDVTGRAWCEATVQRFPDYVDSNANDAIDPTTSLNATNQRFGRKFAVVNFRWLSPEDI